MLSMRRLLAPVAVAVVLAVVGLARPARAEIATLPLTADELDADGHFDVLVDADARLGFEEVRALDETRWGRSRDPNPNLGFTGAAVWIRTQLVNPGDETRRRIAFRYPLLDRVELYSERPDGGFDRVVGGDRLPLSERPFESHLVMFQVVVPAQDATTLYFRVTSESSMQLSFDVATPARQQEAESTWLFVRGGYYGLMLALGLYNFFLFLSIRSRAYFWYVAYVVVFTVMQMALDGTAGRYLFPDSPAFANTFTPLSIAAVTNLPILFAQHFLDTRRNAPRGHQVLNGVLALSLLTTVLAITAPYAISIQIASAVAIIMCVTCLTVGVIVLRGGYRPARFYVLAWSTVLVGTILYACMAFGLLPANAIFSNSQRIGSALEVVLLSFALGDHIATINAERDVARTAALALERDLAVTGTVQKLFLPRQDGFASDALALRGFYSPAAQSGGDWWWYEDCGGGRIRVLLGDVTGHGVGAAMVTAGVAATYRALSPAARDGEVRPIIEALNESIAGICAGAHHMTLGAFEIDTAAGKLRMWSAGAPAAMVLRRGGGIESLSARGTPLGGPSASIGEVSMDIGPGDRIFVFSDGLHERALAGDRQLGYRGVRRLLDELQGRDLEEAHAFVTTRLGELAAETPPLDDIAFVLIDVIDRAQEQAA
jgi:serine phosphatase RsbU (regulator of sigma subunit)